MDAHLLFVLVLLNEEEALAEHAPEGVLNLRRLLVRVAVVQDVRDSARVLSA